MAVELSSFKCGHDAPIYNVIEEIVENSGTPYFAFKDIDENKPVGSIKIRVETIHYFLQRYREDFTRRNAAKRRIEERLAVFRAHLEETIWTTGSLSPELIVRLKRRQERAHL